MPSEGAERSDYLGATWRQGVGRAERILRRFGEPRRIAGLAAILMLGLGALEVVIIFVLLEPGLAALAVLHNPGKHFFHIVLLPVGLFVLLDRFPYSIFLSTTGLQRLFLVAIGLLFLSIAALITIDEIHRFCRPGSFPAPTDIASSQVRAQLARIQSNEHERIRQGLMSGAQRTEIDKVKNAATGEYGRVLANYKNGNCSYWAQSSPRRKIADVLTFLGVCFALLIFYTVLIHVPQRIKPSAGVVDAITVALALVSLWFLFRLYSEWYGRFGIVRASTYVPIYAAGALFIGVTFIFYVVQAARRAQLIVMAVASGSSAVLGLITNLNPPLFEFAASTLASFDRIYVVAIYLVIAISVVSAVWFVMGPQRQMTDVVKATKNKPIARRRRGKAKKS